MGTARKAEALLYHRSSAGNALWNILLLRTEVETKRLICLDIPFDDVPLLLYGVCCIDRLQLFIGFFCFRLQKSNTHLFFHYSGTLVELGCKSMTKDSKF